MKRLKRQSTEIPAREREEMPRGTLRAFKLSEGLPNLTVLQEELQDMWDTLLGRTAPPVKLRDRTLALMEVADAYHARALEIKSHIQNLEASGRVLRGSPLYSFRTGPLQNFIDMSRKASDLGSRRLTEESLRAEAEQRGREYD